mgnify:CR=1 FL=1
MNADIAESKISITGGVVEFLAQTVANLFRNRILKTILADVTKIVEDTLVPKINEDLKKTTHYEIAGIGLDYSQVKVPAVTDNNLVSLFLNGTFFSDAAQTSG